MHLERDATRLRNEADVETHVLTPLLIGEEYLGLPQESVYPKTYLKPTNLDKVAGKTTGYYPDFSIWMEGFLVLIVEAKAPTVPVEEAYREASLYARHVNQERRSGFNPCRYILGCNGVKILVGYHDSHPIIDASVADLQHGSALFALLTDLCGIDVLRKHATDCVARSRVEKAS